MVPPLEESEEGDRASFSRWEKRSVISYHFTELVLEIMEMRMPTSCATSVNLLKIISVGRFDLRKRGKK